MSRRVILCFVSNYLPGNRSGGPIRSIVNFVDHFGDKFDILIVTRDRECGEESPYPSVKVDSWNAVGKAQVFYMSPKNLNFFGFYKIIRSLSYDVIYLNSFFAYPFTILPLILRRIGLIHVKSILIAPRGEFSKGAITIKLWKKKSYIFASKILGLYKNISWQASSIHEKQDILREYKVEVSRISVAPNLSPINIHRVKLPLIRLPGPLRLIFLSRISPKKNLEFLLRVLSRLNHIVELTISGPREDLKYWNSCEKLIRALPSNIRVRINEHIEHSNVIEHLAENDLFVLPTLGENYGHIILEALISGTPVMLSDHTPWLPDFYGAVKVIDLNEEKWLNEIKSRACFSDDKLVEYRKYAIDYAHNFLNQDAVVVSNQNLFNGLC